MNFYSTNKKAPIVDLQTAVLKGLAPDGGLYMPTELPRLPESLFKPNIQANFRSLALETARTFFSDDLPDEVIEEIVNTSYDFPVPIQKIDKNVFVLELFHGPTLAFKDFAARFMARLFGYYAKKTGQNITVLVATSGDTGSAVAHGFLGVPGIDVIILYPSGKVSQIQEKQLTTMGQNVTALEINGTFDDCQKLVKEAFLDNDIQKKINPASANSINIARLLPQSFYYIYTAANFNQEELPLVISVPSGNFGNLTAGLIAKKMGAPIHKFIAATNINDSIPEYLKNGMYSPKPSKQTISNAMDVGNPSNAARVFALYDNSVEAMRNDMIGYSFTDHETIDAIKQVFNNYKHTLDPHGAVGFLGAKAYAGIKKQANLVFLETAHPAKFSDIVNEAINYETSIPERLAEYINRQKNPC